MLPVWDKWLPNIRRGQSHRLGSCHFGIPQCAHEREFTNVKLIKHTEATSEYHFQNKTALL